MLESFSELNDGVILLKIVRAVTQGMFIVKSPKGAKSHGRLGSSANSTSSRGSASIYVDEMFRNKPDFEKFSEIVEPLNSVYEQRFINKLSAQESVNFKPPFISAIHLEPFLLKSGDVLDSARREWYQ